MAEEKRVLNLDEVFGQDMLIKVKWNEKDYELRHITAMSVTEVLQFQKMRRDVVRLQIQDVTENDSLEIESLFNTMIKLLCPDMPLDEMPYVLKPSILAHYFEQIEKKRTAPASRMTGERSSQS